MTCVFPDKSSEQDFWGAFGWILCGPELVALGGTVQSHGHKATKNVTKYLRRRLCFRITITIWASLIVAPIAGSAASEVVASGISASGQFAFDIPAQPLVSALESYSSMTGIETL